MNKQTNKQRATNETVEIASPTSFRVVIENAVKTPGSFKDKVAVILESELFNPTLAISCLVFYFILLFSIFFL